MKHNLIKTDNYLLVVDDSEINDVRPYIGRWHLEKGLMLNKFPTYLTDLTECKLVLAHIPLNGAQVLEGVDLLPPIEDDVEILIPFPNGNGYRDGKEIGVWMKGWEEGHKEGYNKDREKNQNDLIKTLMGFDLEIKKLLLKYPEIEHSLHARMCDEINDVRGRFIQSLQQPKLPIAFECEMELVYYPANMPKEGEERPPYRPKTIINSEGRTEWVGKYIYN